MKHSKFLDPLKEQSLAEKAEEHLQSREGKSDLSSISKAEKYKCLFKRMNSQLLLNVSNSEVSELCEAIAECEADDIPKSVMENIANICLSTTMSLRKIGTLGVGMTQNQVKTKMTEQQIKDSVDILQEHTLDCSARREIITKYKGNNDFSNFTRDDVGNIGTLILSMEDSEIDALPNKALCDQFDKVIMAESKKQLKTLKTREYNGLRLGYDCLNNNAKFNKVFQRMKFADESEICKGTTKNSTTNSRRKRSTSSSVTCSEIRKMGHKANILTQNQIGSLNVQDFKDCVSTLGQISDWNKSEQATPLIGKAKQAYGTDVSKWTAQIIEDLGSIVPGLERTEAEKLQITTLEAASSIGKNGRWHESPNVLQSAFESFLKHARSASMDKLSAADIQSIAELICGADIAKISSMSVDTYKQSAASIGKTKTCVEGQLQKFAELAKKAFGSETEKWSASVVKTVGVVIGGLSKIELSKLGKDAISSLTPDNLKSLPYIQINGLTTQQISWFTISQAASLSKSQYSALDKDKRDIISSKLSAVSSETGQAGSGGYGNNSGENGSTNIKIEFACLFVLSLHVLMAIFI